MEHLTPRQILGMFNQAVKTFLILIESRCRHFVCKSDFRPDASEVLKVLIRSHGPWHGKHGDACLHFWSSGGGGGVGGVGGQRPRVIRADLHTHKHLLRFEKHYPTVRAVWLDQRQLVSPHVTSSGKNRVQAVCVSLCVCSECVSSSPSQFPVDVTC